MNTRQVELFGGPLDGLRVRVAAVADKYVHILDPVLVGGLRIFDPNRTLLYEQDPHRRDRFNLRRRSG